MRQRFALWPSWPHLKQAPSAPSPSPPSSANSSSSSHGSHPAPLSSMRLRTKVWSTVAAHVRLRVHKPNLSCCERSSPLVVACSRAEAVKTAAPTVGAISPARRARRALMLAWSTSTAARVRAAATPSDQYLYSMAAMRAASVAMSASARMACAVSALARENWSFDCSTTLRAVSAASSAACAAAMAAAASSSAACCAFLASALALAFRVGTRLVSCPTSRLYPIMLRWIPLAS